MLFSNPAIITSNSDLRIGGVQADSDMSFFDYIGAVETRIMKLVIDYVKDDMANGASEQDSIKDITRLVHSQLNFQELDFPVDIEGVVEEIMNSEEFKTWQYEIKNKFLNEHPGVNTLNSEIPPGGDNSNINQEIIELVENSDNFIVFLEGLASKNFID